MHGATLIFHGIEVEDPHIWLEEQSPERDDWVLERAIAARKYLDSLPYQNVFKKRLEELLISDEEVPAILTNDIELYVKYVNGQPHYVFKKIAGKPIENSFCFHDPRKNTSLTEMIINIPGTIAAIKINEDGKDTTSQYFLDLVHGFIFQDQLINYSAEIAWSRTGDAVFYKTNDNGYNKHVIDTEFSDDIPLVRLPKKYRPCSIEVFGEDEYFVIKAKDSDMNHFLFLYDNKELTLLSDEPEGMFKASIVHDNIYIMAALDEGNHLYRIPLSNLRKRELIFGPDEFFENVCITEDAIVLRKRDCLNSVIEIYNLNGSFIERLPIPKIGTATIESQDPDLVIAHSSYLQPKAMYKCTGSELSLVWQDDCDFDSKGYVEEQLWFESFDGTKVPITVIHRKDIALDGTNPTILHGYGGYNVALYPSFEKNIIPWIEHGGIYAIPNVRGGGEFGRHWYISGTGLNTGNSVDDFICAAEALCGKRELNGKIQKFSSPEKLGIRGGSRGGMLAGAAYVKHPELFGAAVLNVPVLDLVRYEEGTGHTGGIKEYGKRDNPIAFKTRLSYSPLHNIKDMSHPPMLLQAMYNDERVAPWHCYKMAAALEKTSTEVHLDVDLNNGHLYGRSQHDDIRLNADALSFFAYHLGL